MPSARARAEGLPPKWSRASLLRMPPIIGAAKPVSIAGAIETHGPRKGPQTIGMPNKPLRVIPKRVIEAREARGWKTSELARQAKLSQPTVWALENGETKEVKHSTLQKIAAATGKHVSYFTGEPDQNTLSNVNLRNVPLVSWVQAGKKNSVTDPYQPGAAEEWEETSVVVSEGAFALRVRGDSMVAPDGTGFPEGAIIIVDPGIEARNGDYVVVRFNNSDEATFKRLVVDGPLKMLKPLNPSYPVIPVTEDARLAGVVVEVNLRKRFR
jgi:SOS-response transcriptional repressor LexA